MSTLDNASSNGVVSLLCQVVFALMLAAVLESGVVGQRLSGFFRIAFFIPSILPITVIGGRIVKTDAYPTLDELRGELALRA